MSVVSAKTTLMASVAVARLLEVGMIVLFVSLADGQSLYEQRGAEF
jgi:hypothetical protein